MPETLFVLEPGEQFLVMNFDGSVRRYRAQGWGIEQMTSDGREVIASDDAAAWDGPHSRACGISRHAHGAHCARDCPTCEGKDREA